MPESDIDPILVTRKPTDLPEPVTQAVRGGLQILGEEAEHVFGLPQAIMEQSELLRTTGEYNPAPMVELLGLAAGGGMGAAEKDAIGVFGGRAWAKDTNFLGDPKARKFVPPGSLPALERKYRSAYDSAMLMEMAGKSREEIFDQTGWFRGHEGKWKFEISDKDAKLMQLPDLPPVVDILQHGMSVARKKQRILSQKKLSDILNHPKLFEQYPDLADLHVEWDASPKSASYAPYWEKGYARAGGAKEFISLNPNDPDLLTRILHEVQHAIQAREGFAPGGHSRDSKLLLEADKAHKKFPGSASPYDLAYEAYMRHAGEVEARNVQHRRFLEEIRSLGEFTKHRPWETEDRPSDKLIFREPHERLPRIRLTPVKGDPFAGASNLPAPAMSSPKSKYPRWLETESAIIDAMEQLQSGPGNYVSIEELREAMLARKLGQAGMPLRRKDIDQAIVNLRDQGKLLGAHYGGPRTPEREAAYIVDEDVMDDMGRKGLIHGIALPRKGAPEPSLSYTPPHLRPQPPDVVAKPSQSQTFAERVNQIASQLKTPPFQGRVAIADVYDKYGHEFPDAGSLASFKERVLNEAKGQKLFVSRLDMPEYMDKEKRVRSETPYGRLGDTVHFITEPPDWSGIRWKK